MKYVIFLRCLNSSGYFTGIKSTATNQDVCTHPYISRAQRFDTKAEAMKTAQRIKRYFHGIISYDIIED